MRPGPWIGVDLDGTLAVYPHGGDPDAIGVPIPRMVKRVKDWLAEGHVVKIFTARMAHEEGCKQEAAIVSWCIQHLGQALEVTNAKDYGMMTLYDDRAIQVETNTGRLIGEIG